MKKCLLISHELSVTGAPLSLFSIAKLLNNQFDVTIWSLKEGPLFDAYVDKLSLTANIVIILCLLSVDNRTENIHFKN